MENNSKRESIGENWEPRVQPGRQKWSKENQEKQINVYALGFCHLTSQDRRELRNGWLIVSCFMFLREVKSDKNWNMSVGTNLAIKRLLLILA